MFDEPLRLNKLIGCDKTVDIGCLSLYENALHIVTLNENKQTTTLPFNHFFVVRSNQDLTSTSDTMDLDLPPTECHKHGVIDKHTFLIWMREEADHMGEIGFTANFRDPADIFTPRYIDLNAPLMPADDDFLVFEAAQALGDEVTTMRERQAIMKSNPEVMAETYDWVDEKIIALGGKACEKDYRRLRARVVELYNLEHPPPPRNYVQVWLRPTPDMGTRLMEVSLPIKGAIAKVYDLLESLLKTEAGLRNPFGPKSNLDTTGGVWKYQLLEHDLKRIISKKSTLLNTNTDYETMVELATKGGSKAPIAVLTLELPTKTLTAIAENGTDDDKGKSKGAAGESNEGQESKDVFDTKEWDYPEPLDEDGNPYFTPIGEEDWDTIIQQFNEKHSGMMDY